MDEGASVSCINMGRNGHACAGIAEADARIRALAAENERLKGDLSIIEHGGPSWAERDVLRARIRLLEAEQAEIYAALRADIPQSQIPSWAEAPAFKKGWAEAVQYVWYRVHRVNAAPPRGSEG